MQRFDWKPFALLIAFIAYNFIFTDIYPLQLLTTAGIYCMVTLGLCLLTGYAGQISLGHAAFFGLGGFTSAYLTTRLHWPLLSSFIVSVGLPVIVAIIVGIPTLRLRGHYLAMATLGIGVIIHSMLHSNTALTGGTGGMFNVPPLVIFGFDFNSDQGIYYFVFVWSLVGVLMLLAGNLIRSRPGRALTSLHGNEEAADASGVNTAAYKLKIFVLSAALAAAAGFLYVHKNNYIGVTAADLMMSVVFVAMVALGGMANLWGVLVATVLLSLLPEQLRKFQEMNAADLPAFLHTTLHFSARQLSELLQKLQELDILVYGLIIIIVMIFMPQGIFKGTYDLFVFLKKRILGSRQQAAGSREKI